MSEDALVIAGKSFRSRLMVGTGKYNSPEETVAALDASGAEQTLLTCSDDVLWPNSSVLTLRFCSTRPPVSGDFNVTVALQLSMADRPHHWISTNPSHVAHDSVLKDLWLLGSKISTIHCLFAGLATKKLGERSAKLRDPRPQTLREPKC